MTAQQAIVLDWPTFYDRMRELSRAFLAGERFDRLVFIARGGMTPAHRLAHEIGLPPGGDCLVPMAIRRHETDGVNAKVRFPVLSGPPLPSFGPDERLLLVEDTVGEGLSLRLALAALAEAGARHVTTVSVGLDHADFTRAGGYLRRPGFESILVGFDYWGWLVFPWENEAGGASAPWPAISDRGREAAWREIDAADPTFLTLPPGMLSHWRYDDALAYLQARIKRLRPDAGLSLAVADRREISGADSLDPTLRFYTPELLTRLLRRAGWEGELAVTSGLGSLRAEGRRSPLPSA